MVMKEVLDECPYILSIVFSVCNGLECNERGLFKQFTKCE